MLRYLLLFAALPLFAQDPSPKMILRGYGSPAASRCAGLFAVGWEYKDLNPGGLNYNCTRTGAQAYAWNTVGSGTAAWGGITGTLSAQLDLQAALNSKDAVLTFSAPLSRSTNAISCPTCIINSGSYPDPAWITSIAGSKVTGNIPGGANTAAALATPRAINGVNFDGTAPITIRANLPSNPAACPGGQYVTDIADDGTLTCAAGGSGAATYTPTRTSATVLTLPAVAAPQFRIGNSTCTASIASSTMTVSSGTGTLWIGVASDCSLTVRHNIVASCSAGCTAVSGASGFEPGDIPLYIWTVSSAVLAASGTNLLAAISNQPIECGANMTCADSGGVRTISSNAGSSFPPLDAATTYYEWEDFGTGDCANNSNTVGKLGWRISSNSGGESFNCTTNIGANDPGVITVLTGAGSGNDFSLRLDNLTIATADTFTIKARIRLSSVTSVSQRFGLTDDNFDINNNGIYFEKASGDTNWFGVCESGGTTTRVDTNTAAGTGWVAMQIRRVNASTIGFKVASALGGLAAATEYTVTTNIPSANLKPNFIGATTAAGAKGISVGFKDFLVTGMNR